MCVSLPPSDISDKLLPRKIQPSNLPLNKVFKVYLTVEFNMIKYYLSVIQWNLHYLNTCAPLQS